MIPIIDDYVPGLNLPEFTKGEEKIGEKYTN